MNQLIESLPHTEYNAMADRVRSSHLIKILKSPATYQAAIKAEHKETPALRLGTYIHDVLIFPDNLKQYVALPDFDGHPNSNKYKDAKAEFLNYSQGKTVCSKDELQTLNGMLEAVNNCADAIALLRQQEIYREVTLIYNHGATQLPMRARPDLLTKDFEVIVDVKSTLDCSYDYFSKAIYNYGYYFQAAFYMDAVKTVTGVSPKQFVWLAVEKEPPYEIAIYTASQEIFDIGTQNYEFAVRRLSNCIKKNSFPTSYRGIQEIMLPTWAIQKELI